MNDQQSSPVPDPNRSSSNDELTSNSWSPLSGVDGGGSSGLSDQEAFLMLAMSMSDEEHPEGETVDSQAEAERHGWSVGFAPPNPSADADEQDLSASTPPRQVKASGSDAHPETEVEPSIDLRSQSPFLAGLAKRFRSRANPYDRPTPALVGNHWELHNGFDAANGARVGTVTEVVDLNTVPAPPSSLPGQGGASSIGRDRLLLPPELPEADSDLPPLVFLDTRGDIIPSVRLAKPEDATSPPVVVEWAEDHEGPIVTSVEFELADSTEPDVEVINFDDFDCIDGGGAGEGQADAADEDSTPIVNVPLRIRETDAEQVIDEAGRLFDQYCGPVIAVIASVAQERREIDEALQDIFLTAWESLDSFDADEPLGPWMFTLARRCAFEQVAISRQLALDTVGYPEPSHRDQDVPVDKSWEAWEVRLAVDQLSAAEYDVLQMIHREGLIHPEIAGELDSTVGAVKSSAYSGSRRLVELLDHVIRPDSEVELSEEQASAVTWYLAGVADGSDLDGRERSAVKRIRGQLAGATAWIAPTDGTRDHFLALVRGAVDASPPVTIVEDSPTDLPVADPEVESSGAMLVESPPSSDTPVPGAADSVVVDQLLAVPCASESEQASVAKAAQVDAPIPMLRPSGAIVEPEVGTVPEATGEHRSISRKSRTDAADDENQPPYLSIVVGGALILIAVAVLTNMFGLLSGEGDVARTYQLQPTAVDADATAVVHLTPTDIGTRFEFEFGGLDPSSGGNYYSAWLLRSVDGAAVPLGSFEWETSGATVVLSGPSGYDDFDMIVINDSSRSGEASVADVIVLNAAID